MDDRITHGGCRTKSLRYAAPSSSRRTPAGCGLTLQKSWCTTGARRVRRRRPHPSGYWVSPAGKTSLPHTTSSASNGCARRSGTEKRQPARPGPPHRLATARCGWSTRRSHKHPARDEQERDEAPEQARFSPGAIGRCPSRLGLADSRRSLRALEVSCALAPATIDFNFKDHRRAHRGAPPVPGERGNVDKNVLPALGGGDEPELPFVIPLGERTFNSHLKPLMHRSDPWAAPRSLLPLTPRLRAAARRPSRQVGEPEC